MTRRREADAFLRYATAKEHQCDGFCNWYVYESGHFYDDMMRDASSWATGYDRDIAESLAYDGSDGP